jgi:hypothetical protein
MRRLLVVCVLLLAVAIGTSVAPRRAVASDDLVYIIPAAVGGVVAVIVIVAILMADRTDKEFDVRQSDAPLPEPAAGIRLAPDCAPTAVGRPLLCW